MSTTQASLVIPTVVDDHNGFRSERWYYHQATSTAFDVELCVNTGGASPGARIEAYVGDSEGFCNLSDLRQLQHDLTEQLRHLGAMIDEAETLGMPE